MKKPAAYKWNMHLIKQEINIPVDSENTVPHFQIQSNTMHKKRNRYSLPVVFFIFISGVLISCGSSKNVAKEHLYFQQGMDTVLTQQKETIIQPNDLLSIQVFSKTVNQEQAAVFNVANTSATNSPGYQVNSAGNVELPVIGSVKAVGYTKDELQLSLMQKLTPYVKDPSVVVRFLQFHVNVLGEVRSPGTQKFLVDRVTLIDALSAAGDLTDYGKRDDVMVIREEKGKKIYHKVDLRSRTLFESPAYILQPNDIVYVGTNATKLKNLSADPEAQRKTGVFLAITSVLISLATLIITATN